MQAKVAKDMGSVQGSYGHNLSGIIWKINTAKPIELDEMMKRLKEIEDGVAAPREMQVKVEKEWCCSRNKALKYYKCRRPRSLKAFSVLFSSHYYMRTMTI
ncbi:uncharacterized protein LOC107780518 isoform X3 [Nicotiana tabacum]|uniref:Uncharacterized protein LOC107780518 isoform X3 n=2 Tax=Nicotiana tabacum TaxID=4097 RepID=A0A1S3YWN6_TOBAC|nr:uncharacterized protein LOC104112924 isoform X2 [Nicotiana tomentosiformis]XP_016456558.1 PREDICTED: uncharacterized protein LOC107780518 isoform X2 [Nicotiana tabacum]